MVVVEQPAGPRRLRQAGGPGRRGVAAPAPGADRRRAGAGPGPVRLRQAPRPLQPVSPGGDGRPPRPAGPARSTTCRPTSPADVVALRPVSPRLPGGLAAMRVAERMARRERTWRELDALLSRFEDAGVRRGDASSLLPPRRAGRRGRSTRPPRRRRARTATGRLGAADVVRLGELYRAACADLMLAEAYDLPRDTVAYLHALVGRAHNALYRTRGFRFRTGRPSCSTRCPRRLRRDPTLRLSAAPLLGPDVARRPAGARPAGLRREGGRARAGRLARRDVRRAARGAATARTSS